MTALRVGVVGQVTRDTVTAREGTVERLGGTPVYAARALRAAGAEPVMVVKGPPIDGATTLPSRSQAACSIDQTGGVTRQTVVAVGEPFTRAEMLASVVPALAGCSWVLLGGQSAGDFAEGAVAVLAAAGMRVCVDAQGLARGPDPGPVVLRRFSPAAVAGAAAVKLNRSEADAQEVEPVDLQVQLGVDELLVSDGPAGATVVTAGWADSAAAGPLIYADPTGAGDSLTALYLLGRTTGQPPRIALSGAVELVDRLYAR